jgi:hypothetical protein
LLRKAQNAPKAFSYLLLKVDGLCGCVIDLFLYEIRLDAWVCGADGAASSRLALCAAGRMLIGRRRTSPWTSLRERCSRQGFQAIKRIWYESHFIRSFSKKELVWSLHGAANKKKEICLD